MDNIQKGQYVHQVFMVSKEEGARIIAKIKAEIDDPVLIAELERINNEK